MIESFVYQMGQSNPMGPMRGSSNNYLLWIIIGLLLVIIVYLWYNGRKRGEPVNTDPVLVENPDVDKIEVAMRLLSPNERIVVEALVSNDGEMLQKDLHYQLDLSRVQAHRIVQGLTQRDIVTVEDHYNTKKIRLADWLMR